MARPHVAHLRKRQQSSISVGDPDDEDTQTLPSSTTSRALPTRSTPTSSLTTTDDPDTSTTTEVQSTSRNTPQTSSTRDIPSSRDTPTSIAPSSSSTTTTTLPLSQSTSAVVNNGSTSYVTNIVTVSGPPSSSASAAPSHGGDGSGPSAGMVVGVVAGSLVGIVVIAGLLGYFFKTKFGKDRDDDIDDAVFNKNDFRHESVLLRDDDIDRYSMRSGSAAGSLNLAGMGRTLPGLQRNDTSGPRPPSTFERHYNASPINPTFAVPPMPSFQPGQIVNTNLYHAPSQYASSEGGWGVAASYANQQHLAPGGHLERQPSVASHYGEEGRFDHGQQAGSSVPSYRTLPDHDYPPQNGRSSSPVEQQQFYEGGAATNKATRQLSVRNRDSVDAYDGMGF